MHFVGGKKNIRKEFRCQPYGESFFYSLSEIPTTSQFMHARDLHVPTYNKMHIMGNHSIHPLIYI